MDEQEHEDELPHQTGGEAENEGAWPRVGTVEGAGEQGCADPGRAAIGKAAAAQIFRTRPLTIREMDVFRLIALGFCNAEIGRKLFISDTTVKTHVTRVLQKLDVRDRAQAIVLAYRSGLFDTDDATQAPQP